MSKPARYTLVALGAIALSVTSYAIGNATAQDVGSEGAGSNPGLRSPSGSALAPMPALGAESAYMGLLLERSRWDEALRWRALAQIAEAGEAAGSGGGFPPSTTATAAPGPAPSGDCSGYPSYVPTWRESNNQPDVVNRSSGAMGCAQLMPMHFVPGGTCADLDTSYAGQRECAWRLPSSAWSG